MIEGGVPAVLHVLEILGQLHLGVEQAVLVDVLLVLDLLGVRQLGHGGLMGLFQLRHRGLVVLPDQHLLLGAAGRHRLIVFLVEVGLEVALGVGDELGDLVLVPGLHRLGLLQLLPEPGLLVRLLLGGVNAVPLQAVQRALNVDDPVRAVLPQGVDLLLNAAHIAVDGLAELLLLLRGQNFCVVCHCPSPLTDISR